MTNKIIQFILKAQDGTAAALNGVKKNLSELEKGLGGVNVMSGKVKGAIAALAGSAVVAGLSSLINSATDAAGALEDASIQTNTTIETFQKLSFATKQSGGDVELLKTALTNLNKVWAKAMAGDDKSQAWFKDMGIDPKQIKDGEDLLYKVADAYKNAGNSAEEASKGIALAAKAKIPPEFIQTLQQGGEELKGLGEQAERAGLVIDGHLVKSVADLGDRIDVLKGQAQGLTTTFVAGMSPALTDLMNTYNGATKESGLFYEAGRVVATLGSLVVSAIDLMVTTLLYFGSVVADIGSGVLTDFANTLDRVSIGFTAAARAGKGDWAGVKNVIAESNARVAARDENQAKAVNRTNDIKDAYGKRLAGIITGNVTNPNVAPPPSPAPAGAKPPAPKPFKFGNRSLDKTEKEKKEKPEEIDKARAELAKARAAAVAKFAVAQEKYKQEQIKQLLDDGEITYQDYYDKLVTSQQVAIDYSLQALRVEQAEQEKIANKAGGKEKEKLAAQAKIATITGDIKLLETERGQIAGKAARDQKKSEEELAKAILDVETRTKSLLGTMSSGDRKKVRDESNKKTREEFQRGGKSLEPLDKLDRLEGAKEDWDDTQRKIDEAQESLSSKTRSIEGNQSTSMSEKRSALAAANREAQESIQALIPELEKQAAVLGGPYVDKLRDAQTELQNLKDTADDVAGSINKDLVTGLSSAIESVANGDKSPGQALKDLFKGVGSSIAKMVSDDIASDIYKFMKSSGFDLGKLVSGMMGSGGGGLGDMASKAGSWLSSLFYDGGHTGSGGVYEPAGIVHKGEVVWSQRDVRRAGGVGIVEALRLGGAGYARGGIVKGLNASNVSSFSKAVQQTSRAAVPPPKMPGASEGDMVQPADSVSLTQQFHINTPNAESFRNSQGQIQSRAAIAAQRSIRRDR